MDLDAQPVERRVEHHDLVDRSVESAQRTRVPVVELCCAVHHLDGTVVGVRRPVVRVGLGRRADEDASG